MSELTLNTLLNQKNKLEAQINAATLLRDMANPGEDDYVHYQETEIAKYQAQLDLVNYKISQGQYEQ